MLHDAVEGVVFVRPDAAECILRVEELTGGVVPIARAERALGGRGTLAAVAHLVHRYDVTIAVAFELPPLLITRVETVCEQACSVVMQVELALGSAQLRQRELTIERTAGKFHRGLVAVRQRIPVCALSLQAVPIATRDFGAG